MPPGFERESIAPQSLQESRAERQLFPRTTYVTTLTEGKSSSSSTTIRVLHRLVVRSQAILLRRNRVELHSPRSGSSPSRLEGATSRRVARPITELMATATRLCCSQQIGSIPISLLPIHRIRRLAGAESLMGRDCGLTSSKVCAQGNCVREFSEAAPQPSVWCQ